MDTLTKAAKFRVDELLAILPYEERRAKSAQLGDGPMRKTLHRMRKAYWGDEYSPAGDKLLRIADVLGVTVNELYTTNPEPDLHLPH